MDDTGTLQTSFATGGASSSGDGPQAAIADVLAAFFESVSFKPGERPDYDRLRTLLSPGCRFVNASVHAVEFMDVGEFIVPRQRAVDAGELTAFEEVESSAATDVFASIAQRWSAYTKRGTRHGQDFSGRGYISTQFVFLDGAWRITSMAWEDEA